VYRLIPWRWLIGLVAHPAVMRMMRALKVKVKAKAKAKASA
jgi:hypothetical protein